MRNIITLAIYCFVILSLAACARQSSNYQYLLVHPEFIQSQIEYCQTSAEKEPDYCAMVDKAVTETRNLLLASLQDRQGFGQKILLAQMQLAQYQQALTKLTNQPHGEDKSAADQTAWKQQFENLKLQTQQQEFLIKQYLAIIKIQGIG